MTSIIVVGSGVAGMTAALTAADQGAEVALVYPGPSIAESEGSTQLAQGGIAAAIDRADDVDDHYRDTLAAGAGTVDALAAHQLTFLGQKEVRRLIGAGFPVDKRPDGSIDQGLEAAHSFARIVHAAGDQTGLMLHRFLTSEVAKQPRIVHYPNRQLIELIVSDGQVRGVTVRSGGEELPMLADAVILATGGYCGVYSRSTGAPQATGCGILVAARAGAIVSDMEFVQFHPTVLAGTRNLITEAVRGAGGVLRDDSGRRFMFDFDERGELAPRDVVSNGVFHTLASTGGSVWLDATGIVKEKSAEALNKEFPGISAMLRAEGIDWTRELVPITPAAHYSMGGVATDTKGRTTLPGLFAAGEVANTGVHGANRLASNSLLEGLVFGRRAGEEAVSFGSGAHSEWLHGRTRLRIDDLEVAVPAPTRLVLADNALSAAHAAIDAGLGIERDAAGITACQQSLRQLACDAEAGHIAELGLLIAAGALAREESRGAHRRSDFPGTSEGFARPQGVRLVESPALKPDTVCASTPLTTSTKA